MYKLKMFLDTKEYDGNQIIISENRLPDIYLSDKRYIYPNELDSQYIFFSKKHESFFPNNKSAIYENSTVFAEMVEKMKAVVNHVMIESSKKYISEKFLEYGAYNGGNTTFMNHVNKDPLYLKIDVVCENYPAYLENENEGYHYKSKNTFERKLYSFKVDLSMFPRNNNYIPPFLANKQEFDRVFTDMLNVLPVDLVNRYEKPFHIESVHAFQ